MQSKHRTATMPDLARRTTPDPLVALRIRCLALPEAHEVEAWGEPTFRVRNRIFAMFASSESHHGGGRPAVWCKSTFFTQDQLVHAEPARYFKPPYVGPKGWVGVYLDRRPSWVAVDSLLRDAWRLTVPKRLLALLEPTKPTHPPLHRGTHGGFIALRIQ